MENLALTNGADLCVMLSDHPDPLACRSVVIYCKPLPSPLQRRRAEPSLASGFPLTLTTCP